MRSQAEIEAAKQLTTVRLRAQIDRKFLTSRWLPGVYYGNDWFKLIDEQRYFEKYRAVIDAILDRPGVFVNAIVLNEDSDVVVSYCVAEWTDQGVVLHWIYTKPKWRNLGLAKSIVPENIVAVTHLTKVGKAIKPKEWIFDPFL